jgi:cytochrome P450
LANISARIRNWIRTFFLFFSFAKILNFSLKSFETIKYQAVVEAFTDNNNNEYQPRFQGRSGADGRTVIRPGEVQPGEFHGQERLFLRTIAGPRNCIGQNFGMNLLKVSLAKIMNRFTVTYDASHPVRKVPEAVMKTEDGLWLKFQRMLPE